jgi:hypothetical protein
MTDTNYEYPGKSSPIEQLTVQINSTRDITLAYPELFEPCNIDSFQFYIEKKIERVDYTQEPRIVLLPLGIVSISCSTDNSKVWGDYNTPEYKDLLTRANILITEENKKQRHTHVTMHSEIIGESTFSVNLFPFKDEKSAKVLMDAIEKKDLNSKKRTVT